MFFFTFRVLGLLFRKPFVAMVYLSVLYLGLCYIEEKETKQTLRRTDQGAVRKFITKRKIERKPWFVKFT
jgi:hypothetical protein